MVKAFLGFVAYCCIFGVSLAYGAGAAQDWREDLQDAIRKEAALWKSEPLLYETSGSYFQLVRDAGGQRANGVRYQIAEGKALQMQHQGRRGRLAVIDDEELLEWLRAQFDLSGLDHNGNSWIGLRYWCEFRQLSWTTGKTQPFSAFSAWDTPWYFGDYHCDNTPLVYMGVYIDGASMRWRAAGSEKAFPYYIVEFPAPEASAQTGQEP